MTREEFMQECTLRIVSNLPEHYAMSRGNAEGISEFVRDLSRELYGPTQEDIDEFMRQEAEKIKERQAKESKAEELKKRPKKYILFYIRYNCNSPYNNEDHTECTIRSTQRGYDDVMKEYIISCPFSMTRSESVTCYIAQYCYITEEQANDMLNAVRKKVSISKRLDYIESDDDWYDLVCRYKLDTKDTKNYMKQRNDN